MTNSPDKAHLIFSCPWPISFREMVFENNGHIYIYIYIKPRDRTTTWSSIFSIKIIIQLIYNLFAASF